MALMQITLIPLGTATPSVGDLVAEAVQVLRDKGIPHELGDMGTVVEGDLDTLLAMAREMHNLVLAKEGVGRVVTSILVDERKDCQRCLGEKRQAVEDRLAATQ